MSDWKDFKVPPGTCPACGALHDGAANTTGQGAPEPGDLSICIRCGAAAQYGPGLALLRLSRLDILALPADAQEHITALQAVQKRVVLAPNRPR